MHVFPASGGCHSAVLLCSAGMLLVSPSQRCSHPAQSPRLKSSWLLSESRRESPGCFTSQTLVGGLCLCRPPCLHCPSLAASGPALQIATSHLLRGSRSFPFHVKCPNSSKAVRCEEKSTDLGASLHLRNGGDATTSKGHWQCQQVSRSYLPSSLFCCCGRIPQTGYSIRKRHLFLTVLETRKSKSTTTASMEDLCPLSPHS